MDERQRLRVATLPVHDCHAQPPSSFSAPGHKAINPLTFYAGQAMARYFAQAQRKDAESAGSYSKPGPRYVGAIYDIYLKHKITDMMMAFI